jgi:hypothetical protein
MEVIASCKTFLQQKLGDISSGVDKGGNELPLGASTNDLDLNLTLEQP